MGIRIAAAAFLVSFVSFVAPVNAETRTDADLWIESTMADQFAECTAFFNNMSQWKGMPQDVSRQMEGLALTSIEYLVGLVGRRTAEAKLKIANSLMLEEYAESEPVSPSVLIAKHAEHCTNLLRDPTTVAKSLVPEARRRFPEGI